MTAINGLVQEPCKEEKVDLLSSFVAKDEMYVRDGPEP